MVMFWRKIATKERAFFVVAAIQAAAALGTFIVALIGVWNVAPIISYQIEKQQKEEDIEVLTEPTSPALQTHGKTGDYFVDDVLSWWAGQVQSYQRIMSLISQRQERGLKIKYSIIKSTDVSGIPDTTVDLLVVTASSASGKKEVIKVPVNENAMPPSQYIQCKVNQGAFAELDAAPRQNVENAIGRYIHENMLPRVAPPYIRSGMSMQEIYTEIANQQSQREKALQQMRVLRGVIATAVQDQE